jgi:CheY-specific phosphatase CheX
MKMETNHSKLSELTRIVSSGTQHYLLAAHGIVCGEAIEASAGTSLAPVKGITAIVGMGGAVSMLVAVSFEQTLLIRLFTRETEGLDIPEAERCVYVRETAAEIVNVILGNCIAALEETVNGAARSARIAMSPPVVIADVDTIHRPQDAAYTNVTLKTDFGRCAISIVGPRELFDEQIKGVNVGGKQ